MRLHRSLLASSALVVAACLPALADGLDAQLSTNRVAEGDQVVLTLSAGMGSGVGQPDLSGLNADFTVLGTASGSQTTIINGARSDRQTWQVTLAPKHEGELTVPAITAGAVSSTPLTLEVVDAASLPATAQAGRPSLSVTAPQGTLYAQQEVPLTLQARLPAGTRGAEIVAPTGPGYLLEQRGDDRITTQPDGTTLLERSYLLRPQAAGALDLPGFQIRAEVTDPSARDPFARFGGSPFGNSPFGSVFGGSPFARTRIVTATSAPLSLEVQATPGGASGWVLPAQAVELHEVWQPDDPPVFRVGEAVTRKVQVLALGAHGEQIPDIEMPEIPGARVYFEGADMRSEPTPRGTAALREFTWSIVPTTGGKLTLPELRVEWFNTGTEQAATATLPAESFTVEGPVASTAPPPTSSAQGGTAATPATASAAGRDHWLTAALVAAGLALVAALAAIGTVLVRARRKGAAPAAARPTVSRAGLRAKALARAEAALRKGDIAASHAAVLAWGRAAGLTPDDISLRFPQVASGLHGLEAALFGQSGPRPDLPALREALRRADRSLAQSSARPGVLPPLYPVAG